MTVKPIAATDLIFRDVSLVVPNLPAFLAGYGSAAALVDNMLNSQESNFVKNAADVVENLGRKISAGLPEGNILAKQDWNKLAKNIVRTSLTWGSGFTGFNLAYGFSRDKYDETFNGISKEDKLPEATGNKLIDSFTRENRTIFRDAPSVFISGISLALGQAVTGMFINKDTKFLKDGSLKFIKDEEGRKQTVDGLNNYLRDYLPAALAYSAFFSSIQQIRINYDKLWNKLSAKFNGKDVEAEVDKEKSGNKFGFWKEGLGRIIFRDATSCMLGFLPHRYLRGIFNGLIGAEREEVRTEDGRTVQLFKGAKLSGVQDMLNNLILKDESGIMSAESLSISIATGLGFPSYIGVSAIWQNLYDRAIDSLERQSIDKSANKQIS